ncbi:hypothetical protein SteCoe_31380 [Stentor coeruleus]|uniref:Uncharacterized protein n=1 Tax=Stentor coeruleus TaxID=5963 RepID=A0A1R2B1H8_9CILI|nr:hypothetical protein SteCoe_31380 [Stentor coeruleus]
MKSVFKTAVEENQDFSSWGYSPLKYYKQFLPRFIKKPFNPHKSKSSPPKELPNTTKTKGNYRCQSIMQDLVHFARPVSHGFPKRKSTITSKPIKKPFNRSQSCGSDKISLYEIGNIERLQKLVPVRPIYFSYQEQRKIFQRHSSQLIRSFIVSPQTSRRSYRKYSKNK